MPFYGISVKPLIDILKIKNLSRTNKPNIKPSVSQAWLADDASAAAKLHDLRQWWSDIIEEGEKYGYYVKPSKSWLILCDPQKLPEAETLFEDCPINITVDGKRHLGAALGTETFKASY